MFLAVGGSASQLLSLSLSRQGSAEGSLRSSPRDSDMSKEAPSMKQETTSAASNPGEDADEGANHR